MTAGPTDKTTPRCPRCGGELRFSHREYTGRRMSVDVRRCSACGNTIRGEARPAREPAPPPRTRRPPIDEGPPANPVIDPETAARLLGGEDG